MAALHLLQLVWRLISVNDERQLAVAGSGHTTSSLLPPAPSKAPAVMRGLK